MPPPRPRFPRILLVTVAVLALLAGLLFLSLDHLFEQALRRVVALAEPHGYRVRFDDVHVRWRQAHLTVKGLEVTPDSSLLADPEAAHFTFTSDAVLMQGVDLHALLWDKRLRVGRLSVDRPVLEHSHTTRPIAPSPEQPGDPATSKLDPSLAFIRVDTLIITAASGRSINRAVADRIVSVEELDLSMLGLRFEESGDGRLRIHDDDAQLTLRGISLGLPPFHTLTIAQLHLDAHADELLLTDLRYTPRHGPKDYHRHVRHQQELIAASADSLLLRGFELAGNLYHGAILARSLQVRGGELRTHRDKSIPEGEAAYKPLPAELVREITIPVAIDTIAFERVNVHYAERQHREDAYGTLSFTGIKGVLTGLSDLPRQAPEDLILRGSARLYERGSLELVMRMPMDSAVDRLTATATLRDLPFQVLNRMTDNRTHVTALDGRIHRVEVSFEGTDAQASGTVDVHYEDLKLQVSDVKHARTLSLLANTAVRSRNMPGDRQYRKGAFTVQRARDKGVFNYLWRGIRSGMLEVMLPPVVLKKVRKAEAAAQKRP